MSSFKESILNTLFLKFEHIPYVFYYIVLTLYSWQSGM